LNVFSPKWTFWFFVLTALDLSFGAFNRIIQSSYKGNKETKRQRDKETKRQRDKQTNRQRDKETKRQRDKQTNRQTDK
jgi:Sec-independent protein translocase protein TatA